MSPNGEEKALDVGCGGGHMAVALATWVKELVALDVTPQMLTQTRILGHEKGLSNMRMCLADAQNLPFHSETFDVVSCRIVLHHVSDASKAVAEMGRVLKRNGKLFTQDVLGLDDPVAREYMDIIERLRDPSHVKDYNLDEWNRFFRAAGLRFLHSEIVPGIYQLKEWTSRSGTSMDKVEEIVARLSNMSEEVGKHLRVFHLDGDWSIHMRYLLAVATRNDDESPSRP